LEVYFQLFSTTEAAAPMIAETARLLAVSASFFFSGEPSWPVETACQQTIQI
jgi:hypothetical protein